MSLRCFKAYDIRGRIPDDFNADIAYRIGRAYAEFLQPNKVVVGHDIRLSSPKICTALVNGLLEAGVDVFHIGQCGTEEVYFATSHFEMDGGIVVTASHNPKNYNGMKLVREAAKPVSGDTGLKDIETLVAENRFSATAKQGKLKQLSHQSAYVAKLLSYVDVDSLQSLKIVVNPGNGGAGVVIDLIEPYLPVEIIKIQHTPDGHFPHGVPNPLLVANQAVTIEAIKLHQADLGLAWDGDFDRCFFFDAKGRFIEGYYMVGLLAETFLAKEPGAKIVHDPRMTWNTIELTKKMGGQAILSKTGHAFIKEKMRLEHAIYGGEMSAHHYFRDFSYCDSGMIPWLLVIGLMSYKNQTLAQLVDVGMQRFPVSGEINRRIDDAAEVLKQIETIYQDQAIAVDHTDGLSMEFTQWRFNMRASNTEPVVRLNVESRSDQALMAEKTQALLMLMGGETM